ncbi:MAG: anti-sigma F factor [Clostridia bacterium]|nr:anti-sigma F factor [Clostridia bacterium]
MEIINEMRVMFLSKSENESFSRVAAASFISPLDPTVSELVEIKTAVSEAVSNAIIHGYDGTIGVVTLEMRILDTRTVEITVTDQGKGIPDIEKAKEPLFTTKPDEERAGMGFTVMETFMDSMEIDSAPDKGTRIMMKKSLTTDLT